MHIKVPQHIYHISSKKFGMSGLLGRICCVRVGTRGVESESVGLRERERDRERVRQKRERERERERERGEGRGRERVQRPAQALSP